MKCDLNQGPIRHMLNLIAAAAITVVSAGCDGNPYDAHEVARTRAVEATPTRSVALPAPQPGYFGDEFRDAESRLNGEPVEGLSPTF